MDSAQIVQIINSNFTESEDARRSRMDRNKKNFDFFNLHQDFSHKIKGQSKEFLPKQSIATEQLTQFIYQALIDISKWFEVVAEPGQSIKQNSLISAGEIEALLKRQLDKNEAEMLLSDSIKLGALGSLMIMKVSGKNVERANFKFEPALEEGAEPKVIRKTKSIWQLDLNTIRQEDYYPDPRGDGLYEIQRIEMDYHKLLKIAKDNPDIYDLEAVKSIKGSTGPDEDQEFKKAREKDQDVTSHSGRFRVTIKEFWGTLVDPVTGETLHENCVCATVNDNVLIRKPKPNPLWHQSSPFVTAPIIRIPNSVWHKALMDAPTDLNQAANEVFNLILDSGMSAVFGVKQVREDWMSDPTQIADGIGPITTIRVNALAPPGAMAIESVNSGSFGAAEGANVYNLVEQLLNEAALSNDLRNGRLPQRAVKATEIIASQNALTGIFNGIVKIIEKVYIQKFLDKAWLTCAQHMNDMDDDEIKALFGDERASELAALQKGQIFAETAAGTRFKAFGLSSILNKAMNFQKITMLLQTMGASDILMQEFMNKYSTSGLFGEIVKSLDIDEQKLRLTPEEIAQRQAQQQAALEAQQAEQGNQVTDMSQVPKEQGNEPTDRLTPPNVTNPSNGASPFGGG